MLLVITTPSASAPAGSTYRFEAWAPVMSSGMPDPANCLVMITAAGPAAHTRKASGLAAFTFEISGGEVGGREVDRLVDHHVDARRLGRLDGGVVADLAVGVLRRVADGDRLDSPPP